MNPLLCHECADAPGPINHTIITSSLVSLDTVEVTFVIPAANHLIIIEYRYILCLDINCTTVTADTMPSENNMLSFTISQLIPNSQYSLRVFAVSMVGEGPTPVNDTDAYFFSSATSGKYGYINVFTKTESNFCLYTYSRSVDYVLKTVFCVTLFPHAADGAPANLMVVISTDTQLVLSWTLPALAIQADITVIEFRISWSKDGGSFICSVLPFNSNTPPPQPRYTTLPTLEPATHYTIEVVTVYAAFNFTSDPAVIFATTLPLDQGILL